MKHKNSKRLQLITYSLLSLLLGLSIGLTIYYSILPLVFDRSHIPAPAVMNVRINELTRQPFVFVNGTGFSLRGINGNLIISSPSAAVKTLLALNLFLVWGAISLGLVFARRVLKNIYTGKFFDESNVTLTRIIGLMLIFVPIVKFLFQIIIVKLVGDTVGITIDGMLVSKGFDFSISTLLLGIFIYIFAQIFNEGLRLKLENDLTV